LENKSENHPAFAVVAVQIAIVLIANIFFIFLSFVLYRKIIGLKSVWVK
jgi:hypothetical protein